MVLLAALQRVLEGRVVYGDLPKSREKGVDELDLMHDG
jgi:hypothetical protein